MIGLLQDEGNAIGGSSRWSLLREEKASGGNINFWLCYILVLILKDSVYWSESDEEDWRAPRGKRPPVATINNSV